METDTADPNTKRKERDQREEKTTSISPQRKKASGKGKVVDAAGLWEIETYYKDNPGFSSIPFPVLQDFLVAVKGIEPKGKAKKLLGGTEEILHTLQELDDNRVIHEPALKQRVKRLVEALSK
jgi:hypothetical protein